MRRRRLQRCSRGGTSRRVAMTAAAPADKVAAKQRWGAANALQRRWRRPQGGKVGRGGSRQGRRAAAVKSASQELQGVKVGRGGGTQGGRAAVVVAAAKTLQRRWRPP